MAFRFVSLQPVLLLVAVAAASTAPAQTGPRTLENLLEPTPGDRREQRTPFDGPAPAAAKPAAPPPAPAKPVKRVPVPEQSAVDEALELINQAYEEQIKAAAADPDTAIRTFLDTSDKTTDPARKFALLLLAERIALEADATAQALDVVARRAAMFEIDPLTARHGLLAKIFRAETTRPDEAFHAHVVETVNRAMAADQYDLADAAADLAMSTAKAIEKDERTRTVEARRKREPLPTPVAARLVADATALQKSVRERRRQAFDYTTARDKLAAFPDDAEAAETVGRYLCFVKLDWKAGLAALPKGRHEGLRNLATRENALAKNSAAAATDRLKLANEWWKLSDDTAAFPEPQAEALRIHAGFIYGDIAAKLTDPIDQALARKRAKETGVAEKPAAPAAAAGPDAQSTAGPETRPKPGPPTLDSLLQGDGG
ncbi:MAG: hypothetical protein ACKONH_04910 [Planctomycetia bacterium]